MKALTSSIIGFLFFVLAASPASSQALNATDAERAQLPEYCTFSMFGVYLRQIGTKDEHPRLKYWMALHGKDQHHVHHFCYAQVWLARANKEYRNASQKAKFFEMAYRETVYPINNLVDPEYRLIPDIYTAQGTALAGLKKFEEANSAFEKAVAANSAFLRAYGFAAENRITQNNPKSAREWAERGLQVDPNNTWLKEILRIASK